MGGHVFEEIIGDIEDYALILLNADGRVISWNKGAERIKGYTEQEIKGQHFEVFYTEADRTAGLPNSLLDEARKNGRVQHEGWRVGKHNDKFWAFVVITTVKDENGKIIGFIKITRDLSERIAAEKTISDYEFDLRELALKSQKLRNIYQIFISEVTDYAIIVLDENGIIIDWNPGARKIKGYKYEEIVGNHFSVFYPEEDKNNMLPEALLLKATKEGRAEHEGWRIKKDNSRYWGNTVITSIYDKEGRIKGFTKITRDLTERMETENALKRRIEELEKELAALKINL